MKISKNRIVITSVILCLISLIFPFFIKTENDSLMSAFSTAFTALAAVATVLTLLIAILLYQKFGIESRFIEKQTDKVLELVDLLKGKQLSVITNKFTYYLRFSISTPWNYKPDFYSSMKDKIFLFDITDYDEFIRPILSIKKSYWLPNEIKEKMKFFEIYAFEKGVDDFKNEKYARMNFIFKKERKKDEIEWSNSLPTYTVDQYIKSKNELIKTIEDWLNSHCDIKLDLKMDEENQTL